MATESECTCGRRAHLRVPPPNFGEPVKSRTEIDRYLKRSSVVKSLAASRVYRRIWNAQPGRLIPPALGRCAGPEQRATAWDGLEQERSDLDVGRRQLVCDDVQRNS